MATFPPSVTPPSPSPEGGGSPSAGQGQGGGGAAIKLAMLGQLIQGLSAQFPQAQQGIKMMMDGLRQIQSSLAAGSAQQQPPTPPQ